MDPGTSDAAWKTYALTGRPDFLNYLHRGDVTWPRLWEFYRESPADPGAMIRLMGLFHIFLSQQYDREGCVLDRDAGVYGQIREWARLVVACQDLLPEENLRDSLATLLGQSLVSPLYYEAAFSVYVEASLERHVEGWLSDPGGFEAFRMDPAPEPGDRRLSLHLSELPRCPEPPARERWDATLTTVVGHHYAAWNQAFALALGDDAEEWLDEGGSG